MVAEFHGLNILDSSVQDLANNTTRFLVIGARDCPPTGHDRTSLMFGVPDRAGALFAALEPLQRTGISMSKIESRPSKRKPWEYVFFVDVEGHREDGNILQALKELEHLCSFIKILGSYPMRYRAGDRPRRISFRLAWLPNHAARTEVRQTSKVICWGSDFDFRKWGGLLALRAFDL